MTDYGHDLILGTFHTRRTGTHRHRSASRSSPRARARPRDLPGPPYQPAFLDTWTLLTWVAASTERVHVAGNVLNLPLRPPAVLAARRRASTCSRAAGSRWAWGRCLLGRDRGHGNAAPRAGRGRHGARGGHRHHARHLGHERPDALRVHGTHHQVDGAKRGPAPAHDVPLWIGAVKPRMQRLIGRKGDGWLPSLSYLQPGDLAKGNAVIDEAALSAGRDPSAVRRMLNVNGKFAPNRLGYLQGPVEQWVEELGALALEDGVSGSSSRPTTRARSRSSARRSPRPSASSSLPSGGRLERRPPRTAAGIGPRGAARGHRLRVAARRAHRAGGRAGRPRLRLGPSHLHAIGRPGRGAAPA
ncbi:LLM class flavin-dependent oxidoreductase [Oerskovia sp. M15]